MKRFYVDTNIWLDFALDRKDSIRPLGEFAFQFFKKCIRNRWIVIYSNLVLRELSKQMEPEEINERCFSIVSEENLLRKVSFSEEQGEEAKAICKRLKVPFADAVHAVIARDENATLISRGTHFGPLSEIISVALPEEI